MSRKIDPKMLVLGGVTGLLILSGYHRKSVELDAEDYEMQSCSWCSDDIVSEEDERYMRGELVCDDCESAWHEQPEDGGFRAEGKVSDYEKLEYIHSTLQECGEYPYDDMVETSLGFVEDLREPYFNAEGEDMWRAPTFREEVNEIAWGNMTDREPFEDEETIEKLHEYAIKSFGFEELRAVLLKEGNISPAVQDILEEEAYEAESHALMADMSGIMPPSALWNEEDDEADLDSSIYFSETIISDDFHAEYMADSKSGGSSSRFMKPSEVIDLFKKANGTLVSVTFVKRTNGEVRKMLARTSVKKGVKGVGLKFSPKNKNLMGVYDFQKVREGADPWKCYRFVPVDAVLSMRVRGKTYTA